MPWLSLAIASIVISGCSSDESTGKPVVKETSSQAKIGTPKVKVDADPTLNPKWESLFQRGMALFNEDDEGAVKVLAEAAAVAAKFGKDDERYLLTIREQGATFCRMARYDEGEKLLLEVVKTHDETLGADDASAVQPLNILGSVAIARKDYAKAREYLERGIAVSNKQPFKDPRTLSQLYRQLGEVDYHTGKTEEAIDKFQKAFEIANTEEQRHKGFLVRETYTWLGHCYMQKKDYATASKYYQDVFKNDESDWSVPGQLRAELNLAKSLAALGDNAAADKHFKALVILGDQSISTSVKLTHGTVTHRDTLNAFEEGLFEYSNFMQRAGRTQEARKYKEQALALHKTQARKQ